MAAEAIRDAEGRYSSDRLDGYARRIDARFGRRAQASRPPARRPGWLISPASRLLLGSSWLTRRVLLEDWFLHARRPGLSQRA
jgi:hypothetical protein